MLLQVHDELVFEAPDDEVEATIELVTKVMVEAPEPAVRSTCRCTSTRAPRRIGTRRIERAAKKWEPVFRETRAKTNKTRAEGSEPHSTPRRRPTTPPAATVISALTRNSEG